jgi:hypothetical protein
VGAWLGGGGCSSAVVSSAHGRDTRSGRQFFVSDDGEDVGSKRARDDMIIIATSPRRAKSSLESRNKEERDTGEQGAANAKRICASL